MSFFGRGQSQRSSSVPPKGRLGRSHSFSVPHVKLKDELLSDGDRSNDQRSSFHGQTSFQRGDETIEDLNETILNLKESVMTHATSNAETLEHFNTLQKAHDALYGEHVTLQEQMDDAVELLKYLKEEKVSNEDKIERLEAELKRYQQMTQDSVVSITIENLTKEKMELEMSLETTTRIKEEAVKQAATLKSQQLELEQKVASLQKIQEAYELQTRQTLNSGEKLIALQKEKDNQANIIRDLEGQLLRFKDGGMEAERLKSKLAKLEGEMAVNNDRTSLKDREIDVLTAGMDNLQKELAAKNERLGQQETQIHTLQQKLSHLDGERTSNNDHVNWQESEIKRLMNKVRDLEHELSTKNNELASIDQELIREKAEMQSHLDSLQQQLIHYQEEVENNDHHPSSSNEQHPSQSSTENPSHTAMHPPHEEILFENEQLQYQIQQLESQLQNERTKSQHEAEIHAQLEKEMQDRLAQRLAAHLQESEVSMEARIRKELEEEYSHLMKQQQQQQRQSRAKSFTTSEAKDEPADSTSTAFQRELEEQLRQQLQQVKVERERWQMEQEEFQNRVLLSKQQLDKIREGYRAKYDKEKRRANELQKASDDYQVVITALHQELNSAKEELEDLQMQQSEQKQTSNSSARRSNANWEKERQQFIEREKEYQDNLNDLQAELDELRGIDKECQRLGEEKSNLVKKCKDIFEEHQATLQEMEQLNSENEEFLKKIETLESAAVAMQEANGKKLEEYKELEGQLKELRQSYDESKVSAEKVEVASRVLDLEKRKWADEKALCDKAIADAENARQLLEAERDDLHRKLEDMRSENENQSASVQRLTAAMEVVRTACENEKAAMEKKHLEQLEVFTSKNKELESLITKLTEELAAAVADKDEIQSSNANQLNVKESLESKVIELTERIDQLEGERTMLETSLSETQKSSSEQIQSMQKEKASLESSLRELNEKLCAAEDGKATLIALEEELATLRSSLGEANIANEVLISNHESDNKKYEEQLATLTEANSSLSTQIEALNAKASAANSDKDKLKAIEKENSNLKQELDALRSSVEAANSSNESLISNHESDKKKFEEQLATLTEANSALKTQIEALVAQATMATSNEDKLGLFEEENSTLKQELDALRSSLEAAKNANEASAADRESIKNEYEEQLAKLTDANSALSAQIEAFNAQATATNSDKAKLEALKEENSTLKQELDALRSSLEAANSENKVLANRSNEYKSDMKDCEENMTSLQAEIDRLAEANSTLKDKESRNAAAATSTENLAKELAETKEALKLLRSKFDDVQDTNVTLEEAIQDIQVEKEDIEAENEELATKLGDLTIQAKAMLERNEEMETQLADALMENEFLRRKQNIDNDADLMSLQEKYDDALEIIEQLRNEESSIQRRESNEASFADSAALKRMEEENLELRGVVEHLTNENQAAMEIKLIAMELKSKNTELTESLRLSRHNEQAAVADNERLREQILNVQNFAADGENRVVPYQQNELQPYDNDAEASNLDELKHYKTIVDQLMSDRAIFTQRLGELMNINAHVGSAREMNSMIERLRGSDGAAADSNSRALVTADPQPSEELGEQLRNLTIENGELAQRLGGAVAEKEFALSTLSRLGAKLEELHERNKMLESIANLKSSHVVEVNRRNSFESSFMSSYERVSGDEESKPPLRDPAGGYRENTQSKPSLFGDQKEFDDNTSVGYSVGSYLPQRPLEPEESVDNIHADDSTERDAARDSSSQLEPRMTLIKVPGGEYRGQVNENGQKHGRGKMIYDNGNEYDGTWVANKRDGNGTTKYASGNMYVGAWKEGKRHGFGVFHIKKTGDVYRGNWQRGLKHGSGVYEYADGELDVSVYREDVRVGEGVRWSASRKRASRLVDGTLVGEEGGMSLKDAESVTKSLGFIL